MSRRRSSGPGFRVSDEFVAVHPNSDPTATNLVINLLSAGLLVQAKMDALLRDAYLTAASYNALRVVAGDPEPLTPSIIAERVVVPVTNATMTGILDTLERRGYVERRAHPTDRRRKLVHITMQGRRALARATPNLLNEEKRWTAALSKHARVELADGVGTIADHLRKLG